MTKCIQLRQKLAQAANLSHIDLDTHNSALTVSLPTVIIPMEFRSSQEFAARGYCCHHRESSGHKERAIQKQSAGRGRHPDARYNKCLHFLQMSVDIAPDQRTPCRNCSRRTTATRQRMQLELAAAVACHRCSIAHTSS